MPFPYRWCGTHPGVYVAPNDNDLGRVYGEPMKEAPVDPVLSLKVRVEESCSAAGDCVYDAETEAFLGYTENGTHLDCGTDYKHFDEPRPLVVVDGDGPPQDQS
jgi:hypothetical protein